MHKTRVAVAASRTLFRQGLAALIGVDTEFEICGAAADADEIRRLCARQDPEIIILETELLDAGSDGGMLSCLRAVCPRAAIVVIREAGSAAQTDAEAEHELHHERARALQQGAAAWLPADIDQTELRRVLKAIAAVRQCDEDETADSPSKAEKPAAHGRHNVTEREQMIIRFVAEGMCNKEVAHRLGISTQTVKIHVSHLLEKLALADRTQLAVYAIEHNFEF